MSELRRLFDAPPDEFAVELLRSADADEPEARSLAQAARALGVSALFAGAGVAASGASATGTGLAAASTSASSAAGAGGALAAAPAAASLGAAPAAITLAVLAKHAAFGMVAGLTVMGGLYTTDSLPGLRADRAAPAEQRAANVPTDSDRAPRVRSTATPADPQPVTAAFPLLDESPGAEGRPESASVPSASPANAPSVGRAARSAAAARTAAAPTTPVEAPATSSAPPPAEAEARAPSLSREVELLDRARGALLGGDAILALAVLDEYASAEGPRVLGPEAQVLRIQVLERLGRRRAASALARDFVARHPTSRHAAALEPLAERADEQP